MKLHELGAYIERQTRGLTGRQFNFKVKKISKRITVPKKVRLYLWEEWLLVYKHIDQKKYTIIARQDHHKHWDIGERHNFANPPTPVQAIHS